MYYYSKYLYLFILLISFSCIKAQLTYDSSLKVKYDSLFNNYLNYVIRACSKNSIVFSNGKWRFRNLSGINGLSCLSSMGYNLKNPELLGIYENHLFYEWLLNPKKYNYENFDHLWLVDLCRLTFTKNNLNEIPELVDQIHSELRSNFNKRLSEFYNRYLNKSQ